MLLILHDERSDLHFNGSKSKLYLWNREKEALFPILTVFVELLGLFLV